MNDFTIFCTEEQTKKALELGAPIEKRLRKELNWVIGRVYENILPTAEQMIGWLELQVDNIDVLKNNNGKWVYLFYPTPNSRIYECEDKFLSRKEATLAAIDKALDYLTHKD